MCRSCFPQNLSVVVHMTHPAGLRGGVGPGRGKGPYRTAKAGTPRSLICTGNGEGFAGEARLCFVPTRLETLVDEIRWGVNQNTVFGRTGGKRGAPAHTESGLYIGQTGGVQ